MLYLSTTLLITVSVIVVSKDVARAQDVNDQLAMESRSAITIVDGPKYVTHSPPRPSTKAPVSTPDIPNKPPGPPGPKRPPNYNFRQYPSRPYYPSIKPTIYSKRPPPSKLPYTYSKFGPHRNHQPPRLPRYPSPQNQQIVFAASTGKPIIVSPKSPKFIKLPVQTINGIRNYDVKPPKIDYNTTTTTTTTTTEKPRRNKRIWPKHILNKIKGTVAMSDSTTNDTTLTNATTKNSTMNHDLIDHEASASVHVHVRHVDNAPRSSTAGPPRGYRRVVRVPKHRSSTAPPPTMSPIEPNDWVPLVPSYRKSIQRLIPNKHRRSDSGYAMEPQTPAEDRRTLYLHSYGVVPLKSQGQSGTRRKKFNGRKRKRQLKPNGHSDFGGHVRPSKTHVLWSNSEQEPHHHVRPSNTHVLWSNSEHESHPPIITKIKHHHHHHHHRYTKTVEKPVEVPVKIEVPKPYPVHVEKKIPIPVPVEKVVNKVIEKKVPYPVTIEKRVPYPVQVKVPQVIPVKVVEKEYVPKPYPIVHHVPVIKQVEVKVPQPVPFEKKVPYPVHIRVPYPVDRPVRVPVPFEKKVPYAVPFKVLVPQPYPVETKVPYPVEVKVKEPVEVIRHVRVPVKVPVPQPVPVKVPHPVPVPVEKRVPYPVEVEKKVPVPVKVYVPKTVTVEKKVPVYVPQPYPVEKKIHVPVPVPVYHEHHVSPSPQIFSPSEPTPFEALVGTGLTVSDVTVTQNPHHTVTYHGNGHFTGFSDRSDVTTPIPSTTDS